MVNQIPKYKSLVILARREHHDLAAELKRFDCARVSIHGTPENLEALSKYPAIEEVSLHYCDVPDLNALRGLTRLRQLRVAFGTLENVDLDFCKNALGFLVLSRLRRVKDLSTLPAMPNLEHLSINHIHSFAPPNFGLFPNLRHLSVWNTEWNSLSWLAHLPNLETLHISQIKVKDQDWKPILGLKRLHHLHGMKSVFQSKACDEFIGMRPKVVVDRGIPVDLEKNPQAKEFLAELHRKQN